MFGAPVSQDDVENEAISKDWADGARISYWVGMALLGTFLVGLVNAIPPRVTDPTWQLSLISIILSSGGVPLLGALLICLARLFNRRDHDIASRSRLVRTLASWVALGWLLLIPLQLFIGVRLINSQARQEVADIQKLETISRAVRNATSEDDLRVALAQIPNQPPLPRLTVPLEIAKANLLAQFQKNINTARNRQEEGSSTRWQTWMKDALRNSLQSFVLGLGFLAVGKNRVLNPGPTAVPSSGKRQNRSRSRG
jgi:hypothetical protein